MPDLSDSVNWSETDALNNNAAPNGWPEGMMPSGVNDAARADRGALKRFWNKVNPVQTVTPVGGVYTFTTANSAYPTGYLEGEIYCFRPGGPAIGGDQFQVNSLGIKPIWKLVSAGVRAPILAQDILGVKVQLLYVASLNDGAGAFMLVNPFVPIHGDGAGGVSVPGDLAVAGDLTMAGSIVANGGMSINGDLEVTGPLSATGYKSRSGVDGPYQTNLWNIQWTGSDGAHLWIDTTDQGPIVCSSGGNIVIGGSITAGSITTSGNISAGTLSVSGNTTLTGSLSAPSATIAGTITCQGVIATNVVSIDHMYPNADNHSFSGVGGHAWAQVLSYSYPSPSDPSLKQDIEPAPAGCLDLVRAIEPRTYKWAKPHEDDAGKTHWGFMAPEVRNIVEGAGHKFGAVREENGLNSLDYNEMTVVLWAAVRELAERLERK